VPPVDGPEVSEGARARAPYVFLAAAEAGEGMRMARGYGRVCAAENLFCYPLLVLFLIF
jgi:hypothetical protein